MHSWLSAGLMERVISARRMIACVALVLFVCIAVPAIAQQAQPSQQPVVMANAQSDAMAQHAPSQEAGGEDKLVLPDMKSVSFLSGRINGFNLLSIGLIFCALGGVFGLVIYMQLKNLPVHKSMLEISELIYETCKTYLITQGKFILILWAFIAVVIVLYFGVLVQA